MPVSTNGAYFLPYPFRQYNTDGIAFVPVRYFDWRRGAFVTDMKKVSVPTTNIPSALSRCDK